MQRIAIISSPGKSSYVNRKLKKNTGYKYEVRAYRIRNGKKIVVGRSLQLHAFTKGSKTYDNPAGVRISGNGKRTLKVGKSIKINAKVVLSKDKKCRWCNGKSQSDRKELNSDIAEYKSIPLSFFLLYDGRKRRVNWQWIE